MGLKEYRLFLPRILSVRVSSMAMKFLSALVGLALIRTTTAAITVPDTYQIASGGAVTIAGLTGSNYLCWTAGTTITATTAEAVVPCVESGNTAANCLSTCAVATATVVTPASGGGTACVGDYTCTNGDGDCASLACFQHANYGSKGACAEAITIKVFAGDVATNWAHGQQPDPVIESSTDTITSAAACQHECLQTAGCEFFVYLTAAFDPASFGQTCWLKQAITCEPAYGFGENSDNTVSGPQTCQAPEVCSNVVGVQSATYPCKCGTSTGAAVVECTNGQLCTAGSDTDGECAEAPVVAVCTNLVGAASSAYAGEKCTCGSTQCNTGELCTEGVCAAAPSTDANPFTPSTTGEACLDDDEANAESKTCCDATDANNAQCVADIAWASGEGIQAHQKWYDVYGVDTADPASTNAADFQCALFWITTEERVKIKAAGSQTGSDDKGCPRPCSSDLAKNPYCEKPPAEVDPAWNVATQSDAANSPKCPSLEVPNCTLNNECETKEPIPAVCDDPTSPLCVALACEKSVCGACSVATQDAEPSMATWVIVVIVVLVLLVAAFAVYLIMGSGKKKTQKKKRAVVPKKKAPEPAPAPKAPSITLAPVPVTTAMMMQPMLHHPVHTMALPIGMHPMNAQHTTAIPMAQYQSPYQQHGQHQLQFGVAPQPHMVQQQQHFG